MHVRGNKPVGIVAKIIMVLILVVGIMIIAIGIYAVRGEQAPVRGAQALPGQVAEQLGQSKRPATARPK